MNVELMEINCLALNTSSNISHKPSSNSQKNCWERGSPIDCAGLRSMGWATDPPWSSLEAEIIGKVSVNPGHRSLGNCWATSRKGAASYGRKWESLLEWATHETGPKLSLDKALEAVNKLGHREEGWSCWSKTLAEDKEWATVEIGPSSRRPGQRG